MQLSFIFRNHMAQICIGPGKVKHFLLAFYTQNSIATLGSYDFYAFSQWTAVVCFTQEHSP